MLSINSKVMKLILSITSVLLFGLGFWICNLLYPDACGAQINQWWDMRMNIYAIILLTCFSVALSKEDNKHLRFVLSIGIGLSASDVIDRIFFNISQFTKEDVSMVIATFIISYVESYTNFSIKKLWLSLKSKK